MKELEQIKRIKALAEMGLVYAEDEYNRERYEELKQIALELMASVANQPLSILENFYMPVTDYPTPKVDVRGFVLNEKNQVLMAKESIDGKWTILRMGRSWLHSLNLCHKRNRGRNWAEHNCS
ncbi:NUDIX hydrolase [Zobellia laminariae]|uniref:NUDIX hydrolase n=1 Tax=Zobellia laminariae TaxID=248906 RepID=UPI0026F41CB4|nr:NUDIX hydrolase N-terminal domain-containing protein [Zobellia laminariae]WKX77735.1 NUDIX hydrolase N-terminal domain-containing protein [Zobellia laminariae]